MTDTPAPAIGQVWRYHHATRTRDRTRYIRIIRLEPGYARVESWWADEDNIRRRTSTIRLDRFRMHRGLGYEYIRTEPVDTRLPDSDVMTAGEAAKWCGVDTSTLHRWGDQGKVRFEQTASGWRRYRREDLAAAIGRTEEK